MHEDRGLIEQRIRREVWTRVLPLVHPERLPMSVAAVVGSERPEAHDAFQPFAVGDRWGAPWETTWFELTARVPDGWADRRVEAVIDLGFSLDVAGFQCEGLVVDEDGRPVQGIHPRRTAVAIAPHVVAAGGPVRLVVEAASNPVFPQFTPSQMGSLDTAGDRPLYRFERADLVVVDTEAEALLADVDVLAGVMHQLGLDDPRRTQIRTGLVAALDALPDVAVARGHLAELLAVGARGSAHRILATGHAHIDTAWLWPIRETVRKCTRTFASVVAMMDDDPDFRFACSQAQQYAWIEARHPELFERIRDKVVSGQWEPVGGMWVEADMNLPSGESLVRQITFGQRYFESRFGRRCSEVWIPDVFGYPAGLPQVFAAGGMRRFVTQKLSWNTSNRIPHHTFWWEGLDGTRVLTHFPPVDTYNCEVRPEELAHASANFADHAWSRWSLLPFGHGDGGGGPTREMLGRARRMADLDPMPTVELGTPDDYFTAVEAELAAGAEAPVWRGELYFETHRGTLTSQLGTKLGNRRCERLLYELELYCAMAGRQADAAGLWCDVLTQQFHDILPGSSIAWVHADAEAAFERVAAELEARIADVLGGLTVGGVPVGVLAVANPAGHDRREVIELGAGRRVEASVLGVAHLVGRDREAGVELVAERSAGTAGTTWRGDWAADAELSGSGGVVLQDLSDGGTAVGVDAAACSFGPVRPAAFERGVVVTDRSMSNGHLAMRWDPDGAIVSLIDVTHARDLLAEGQRAAVLELAPDLPVHYDAWDLESWTRSHARVVERGADDDPPRIVEAGPLVGRVEVTRRFGPSVATVSYSLRAGSPRLDIAIDLDWRHDEHLLSMVFPLDVHTDTAWCDVQFGVVGRPTHRSTSWDAAKFEVCAHRFVALSEPGFGAAVLNNGRYGHSVFDGAVRVSLARAAKYPDPGADHGRHRVTLSLMAHRGDLAPVRAEAEALNRPLRLFGGGADGAGVDEVAVAADVAGSEAGGAGGEHTGVGETESGASASAGVDPSSAVRAGRSFVSVDGDGIELDAVKPADDGSGDLIVRLHEHRGARTRVTLHAPWPIADAARCNLLEEPEGGYEVSDGVLAVTLHPFQLLTLRLTPNLARRQATAATHHS